MSETTLLLGRYDTGPTHLPVMDTIPQELGREVIEAIEQREPLPLPREHQGVTDALQDMIGRPHGFFQDHLAEILAATQDRAMVNTDSLGNVQTRLAILNADEGGKTKYDCDAVVVTFHHKPQDAEGRVPDEPLTAVVIETKIESRETDNYFLRVTHLPGEQGGSRTEIFRDYQEVPTDELDLDLAAYAASARVVLGLVNLAGADDAAAITKSNLITPAEGRLSMAIPWVFHGTSAPRLDGFELVGIENTHTGKTFPESLLHNEELVNPVADLGQHMLLLYSR